LKKRQKKILTWIVVWAGLLIIVLYSPVGSPGLYSSQNYYTDNQSVPLIRSGFNHSHKVTSSSEDVDNGSAFPENSSTPVTNYTTGNYQSANSLSRGTSYSTNQSSDQNTNKSTTSATGGAGISMIARRGSGSNNGNSAIAMTNGIASISTTDLSSTNTITKQSSQQSTQSTGATDPGGDPTNAPIPVGNSWEALMLFGGIYVLLKMKVTSRKLV